MNNYSLHRYLQTKVEEKCKKLPLEFNDINEWHQYRTNLKNWLIESLPVVRNSYTGKGESTGVFEISDTVELETVDVMFDENLAIPVSIYRPNVAGPHPAVLVCPGFGTPANTGYYVSFAIGLAQKGIAAAVIEYGGTGLCADRPDCETNINNIASAAHLLGMNEAGFRVSYNISVYEFLRCDPKVISDRIGITGLCQGAITAMYTIVVEEGFAAFSPLCGVSTYEAEVLDYSGRQGGWTGISPFVFNVLEYGDFMHFIASFAPKPLFVVNNLTDIHWPLQGLEKTKKFARNIYGLADASDACSFRLTNSPHSYEGENASSITEFFINAIGV